MTQDHRNGDDKIETHYRLQLSALMDGALPPDEARFLLRRLQHDAELSGCWERWQMAGETLRGRAVAPLPAGFSQRVATLVAAEPKPAVRASTIPRWTRWGGGALAASVALLALFMTRQQSPVDPGPESQPSQIVAASSAPPAPAPEPVAPPPQPAADQTANQNAAAAALAATAVAVAEVPRRSAANRRASSRSQSQRAAARLRGNDAPVAVAAASPAPTAGAPELPSIAINPVAPTAIATSDPFASQPIAPSRPWPSATLPQFPTSGALSVDYGPANSYYPFQPRLPASSQAASTGAESLQETPQR